MGDFFFLSEIRFCLTCDKQNARLVVLTYEKEFVLFLAVLEYKYPSWVYGVDRKICHEGH